MTDGGRAARAIWKIGPGQKDPRSNEQWSGQRRDTTDGYFNFALGDPPLAVSPLPPLSPTFLSLLPFHPIFGVESQDEREHRYIQISQKS